MRMDRWLWCTRFYKTRALATEAIRGGHVKLDGQRCKAAKAVAVGDQLSITKGKETWDVTILVLPSRRGPATEAQACFAESVTSIEQRLAQRQLRRETVELAPTSGRPDRRTRRLIRFKRGRS